MYAVYNSLSPVSPPEEIVTNQQVNGYFANGSIGFYKTLFFDASARIDQSSSLPFKNNTYMYGSLAAGFVFYELVKDQLPWLSSGKFRANYALVGNSPAPSQIKDVYYK
ncbi:MAG: hypothetical protein K2X37_02160, partial [Chitinophagaceae bacterium]|nr:hypothetical protein [Chitinophagaceae bacterium]